MNSHSREQRSIFFPSGLFCSADENRCCGLQLIAEMTSSAKMSRRCVADLCFDAGMGSIPSGFQNCVSYFRLNYDLLCSAIPKPVLPEEPRSGRGLCVRNCRVRLHPCCGSVRKPQYGVR